MGRNKILLLMLTVGMAATPTHTLQLMQQAWNSSKARKVTAVVVGGCIIAGLIWRALRTPSTSDNRPQQPGAAPSLTTAVQALAAQAKTEKVVQADTQKKSVAQVVIMPVLDLDAPAQQQSSTARRLPRAATQVGIPAPRSVPKVSAAAAAERKRIQSIDLYEIWEKYGGEDMCGGGKKIDFQVTPISAAATAASTTPVVKSRASVLASPPSPSLNDESDSEDTGGRTIPISPRPQPGERQVTVVMVNGKPVTIKRRT